MKKLIDNCENHNYVWLKRESIPVPEPELRIYNKDIYVCVDCGKGLDFYNLDEPITVATPPKQEVNK